MNPPFSLEFIVLDQPVRQPMFNVPTVVVAIAAVLILIFYVQSQMDEMAQLELIRRFAFVPVRVSYWFDHNVAVTMAAGTDPGSGDAAALAQFFIGDGYLMPWTVLTYALLHGSWTHVVLNVLWLMSFGAAVARRFSTFSFLSLCVTTAMAGAALHYIVHPLGPEPVIGASAIVSGCMGAAMRFAFSPGAPLGDSNGLIFMSRHAAYHLPAPPMRAVLTNARAMTFFAVWFVLNLLFGLGSTLFGLGDAPIAWEAHIGGFLAGFLLFSLFDRVKR